MEEKKQRPLPRPVSEASKDPKEDSGSSKKKKDKRLGLQQKVCFLDSCSCCSKTRFLSVFLFCDVIANKKIAKKKIRIIAISSYQI